MTKVKDEDLDSCGKSLVRKKWSDQAKEVASVAGVSKVLLADSPAYTGFLPEHLTPLLVSAQNQFKYTHIVAGASAFSRSVLPRLAAQLDVSPISDIIGIKDSETFVRTVYAVRRNVRARSIYSYLSEGEVTMELQEISQVNFGEGFTARVDIENKTENIRTLETIITCTSLYYNGVPAHRIKVAKGRFTVKGGKRDTVSLVVTAEEYLGRLVEYCHL